MGRFCDRYAERMLGLWIHRGAEGERGAAVFQVLGRDETGGAGALRLPPGDHARLREGRYYLALYTRDDPAGLRALTGVKN